MKVCGVELKANDAIISLMSLENGLYALLDCRVKKLSINDAGDGEQLKKFQFDFAKLMADYQIEHVVIRERMKKANLPVVLLVLNLKPLFNWLMTSAYL